MNGTHTEGGVCGGVGEGVVWAGGGGGQVNTTATGVSLRWIRHREEGDGSTGLD